MIFASMVVVGVLYAGIVLALLFHGYSRVEANPVLDDPESASFMPSPLSPYRPGCMPISCDRDGTPVGCAEPVAVDSEFGLPLDA